MASVPRRTSWRKWRDTRGASATDSSGAVTSPRRRSPASSAAAGSATATAPHRELLDAAIIFAPAGELVPAALGAVRKGGTVVCGGIHMSDIPSFPYAKLWGERVLRSVANLTRRDGEEFLALAARIPYGPK